MNSSVAKYRSNSLPYLSDWRQNVLDAIQLASGNGETNISVKLPYAIYEKLEAEFAALGYKTNHDIYFTSNDIKLNLDWS